MNAQFYDLIKEVITDQEISNILQETNELLEKNCNQDIYKLIFGLLDLTSLNVTDSVDSITIFVNKVNNFRVNYPDMPEVSALCVYPNFVGQLKNSLNSKRIKIAAVAGGFPSSQTFIEIKIAEVNLALLDGADEIDIVMPVGSFINEEYDAVYEEISEIKQLLKEKHLKVILETGELKTPKLIFIAAILAMESGADFIKTSTGKTSVSATPEAAIVMCKAIEWYYKKTGKMVGIKMAGGIVTVEDAILYYTIVENILGKEWLKPELFRIGASRLANNLISASNNLNELKYF